MPQLPPSSGGSFFRKDSPRERAPGSAASVGVEDWTGLHFSPRMPNPLSQFHLDFIFSFEIAQTAEYIDATVDALLSREFKFPANINTESTFQGEILDLKG